MGRKMKNLLNTMKITCFAAVVALSTSAHASEIIGTVYNVTGEVLIERNGAQFTVVKETGLLVDDKIIIQDNSAGNVKMNDGCEESFTEAGTVLVGSGNFCGNFEKYAQNQKTKTPGTTGTAGKATAATKAKSATNWPLIAGLGAAAVGVGIIVATDDDDSNVASSP